MASNEYGSGSFPTMGTSAAQLSNVAKPLRGRLVAKGGPKGGAYPESNKANRSNVLERQGATLHPVMSHVQQNNPEASATGRNVYTVPSVSSKVGNFSQSKAMYC
ncbi:hypothetical protein HWB05_gp049 [Streptomyces phage BRock]|uniref:Uncharacterized protein n=1 Tax=Streptomyces phage BRock TaxID=1913591 RepID=A0A1J0GVU7_9CAUD|nr:hypothetical protein HWB05_gp049 [Streptomyces phage BRock]APC46311.1 hypothetical protein [Streptomyces phage BRock]